jgi:hypothetical protein
VDCQPCRVTAVATIALILAPAGAARLPWRPGGRAGQTLSTRRCTIAFASSLAAQQVRACARNASTVRRPPDRASSAGSRDVDCELLTIRCVARESAEDRRSSSRWPKEVNRPEGLSGRRRGLRTQPMERSVRESVGVVRWGSGLQRWPMSRESNGLISVAASSSSKASKISPIRRGPDGLRDRASEDGCGYAG